MVARASRYGLEGQAGSTSERGRPRFSARGDLVLEYLDSSRRVTTNLGLSAAEELKTYSHEKILEHGTGRRIASWRVFRDKTGDLK